MSLATIRESLKSAYDVVVVPAVMLDTPIAMVKMVKVDEEGEEIGHYSINELSQGLGDFFKPTHIIDERFVAFRWSIPRDEEEETNIREYLSANGLASMRAVGVKPEDIDYASLSIMSFGIFSNEEFKSVPRVEAVEV